jgi:hypothetical protein
MPIVSGEKAAQDGHIPILRSRGRPKKPCNNEHVARFPASYGSAGHWLARLVRDGHAELAARVRAGALTAHAAAVLVGYRKTARRKKPSSKFAAIEGMIG